MSAGKKPNNSLHVHMYYNYKQRIKNMDIITCVVPFQITSKVLQERQRSLEQKEKQLMETRKQIDEAENQNMLRNKKLLELQTSSQQVAKQAAELAEERKDLKNELSRKKKRKERLMAQMPFMTDKELSLQLIDEVQASIDDIEKHIAQLKMKIKQQNAKQKKLKEDIAKKQNELDDSNRNLQASKTDCSLLQSKLNTEKMAFDLKLREQLQSSETTQAELKVCLM